MKPVTTFVGIVAVAASLVGVFGILSPAWAPPSQKPEKIQIDNVTWDVVNQEFVIAMSAKFGLATAGEQADFTISVGLEISHPGNVASLAYEYAVARAEPSGGQGPGADYLVSVNGARIPWDRANGTVFGTVHVTTTAKLIGPSGQVIGNPVMDPRDVLLGQIGDNP
jgi:hypothetical protein